MSTRFSSIAALLLLGACLRAQGQESPAGGEKKWELNEFLKGTASQIQKTLNGETERLAGRRNVLLADTRHAQEALAAEQKSAMGRLSVDPQDVQLHQATTAADERRTSARAEGTMQDKLDASSAFVAAKQAVDKYERDFLAGDKGLAEVRKAADEAQRNLEQCDRSLVSAFRWRTRLADAIHQTFMIDWPLADGAEGIFGEVTVAKVIDDRRAFVQFNAAEPVGDGKQEEGVVTFKVRVHPTLVLLTGIETGSMRREQTVQTSQVFRIARHLTDEDLGRIPVAEPSPGDLEHLLGLIAPAPAGMTAADVAEIEKQSATHKKSNPKVWTSFAGILAAIPADKRPVKGKNWSDTLMDAANGWLGGQIDGDLLDMTVTLHSAEAAPDGGFTIHGVIGTLSTGGGVRQNEVTAHCAAALLDRVKKMRMGHQVRMVGAVQDIRAAGFDTFQVELQDVSFKD